MARIELKNTLIYIRDGFTETGAVDDAAGYAADATTMAVDTFTTALEIGVLFTVVGSDRLHRVTAVSGSPATSITFTPALRGGAVADDAVISVVGRSIEITVGDGNLTWSETKNYNYDLDRGSLDTVRTGDEEPIEVSLDLVFEFIRSLSADEPTVDEALKNKDRASGWTTSATDICEPYSVDIVVEQLQPCGSVAPEMYIFPDYRHESLDFDMDEATISMSGRCNVLEPTITRLLTS